MTKIVYKIGGAIFSILLFFVLLFTSMEVIVYNQNYYENHYIKRDIANNIGISNEELMDVTEKMLDYLRDKRETLDMTAMINGEVREVFGERDKAHMVDVKNLFIGATNIRNVSLVLLLLIIAYSAYKNKQLLKTILSSIKYTFAVIITLLIALGILLYIDFNKYFIIFHKIFFDNDLWLLSPSSVLINMVPEVFFYSTAMIIIGIFLVTIVVTVAVAEVVIRRLARV